MRNGGEDLGLVVRMMGDVQEMCVSHIFIVCSCACARVHVCIPEGDYAHYAISVGDELIASFPSCAL